MGTLDAEYTQELRALQSGETYKKRLSAYHSSGRHSDLRELVRLAYGNLPRPQLFSFIREHLPARSNDDVAYGVMFEMMIFSLSTWRRYDLAKPLLERIVEEERRLNGESYWLHNLQGCLAFNESQSDPDAYTQFALGSAKLRSFDDTYHISSGMDAIRPLSFDPSLFADQTHASGFTVIHRPANQPDFVHLVAADPIYFERYIERLLSGSEEHRRERNVALHCHIAAPNDASLALAANLRERFPLFGVSVDTPSFPDDIRRRSQMSYFASVRFLFAADILNLYRCGMVVTDIDVEVTQPYTEVIDTAAAHHAAFSCGVASLANFYPWLRVGAQLSVFQPSDKGTAIASA